MKKYLLLASLGVVVLTGAGCVEKTNVRDASSRANIPSTYDASDEGFYAALSCNQGMKLFQGARLDIEFCYPESDGQEGEVTVREDEDGVVLLVNNEEKRKIWVAEIDEDQKREDIVQGYAVGNPEGVTCGVLGIDDDVEGRYAYMLVGEDGRGEQNLDSVTACTYLESEDEEGFDKNMQRAGTFYFYDREPQIMYILTGEQEPSLGEMTEQFTESLQPKK